MRSTQVLREQVGGVAALHPPQLRRRTGGAQHRLGLILTEVPVALVVDEHDGRRRDLADHGHRVDATLRRHARRCAPASGRASRRASTGDAASSSTRPTPFGRSRPPHHAGPEIATTASARRPRHRARRCRRRGRWPPRPCSCRSGQAGPSRAPARRPPQRRGTPVRRACSCPSRGRGRACRGRAR